MRIGHHRIEPALVLAPMAGITDKPTRGYYLIAGGPQYSLLSP